MRDRSPKKFSHSQLLAKQTEEFLARGGMITKLTPCARVEDSWKPPTMLNKVATDKRLARLGIKRELVLG